jgi:hypothetical protein
MARAERQTGYFEDDFTQRCASGDIRVSHFGVSAGAASSVAEARRARLRASASHARVCSGRRISLVGDVQPGPRRHACAPGVRGGSACGYVPGRGDAAPGGARRDGAGVRRCIPPGVQRDDHPPCGGQAATRYGSVVCYPPAAVPVRWTLQVEGHECGHATADCNARGKREGIEQRRAGCALRPRPPLRIAASAQAAPGARGGVLAHAAPLRAQFSAAWTRVDTRWTRDDQPSPVEVQ